MLPSARASYRLRIFTPRAELPFAGHPTIGSAHAVREAGLVPRRRAAGAGMRRRVDPAGGRTGRRDRRARAARARHTFSARGGARRAAGAHRSPIPASSTWGRAGSSPRVGSVEVLRGLAPDLNAMTELDRRTDTTGVTVYAIDDDRGAASVELRSFAPLHGIAEDPVCGSGNASVGAYLHATGGLARFPGGRYLARQGAAVGRAGRDPGQRRRVRRGRRPRDPHRRQGGHRHRGDDPTRVSTSAGSPSAARRRPEIRPAATRWRGSCRPRRRRPGAASSSNACSNRRCAVRAPESVSPTTGKPAPAKWRRIWRVRPVSRRTTSAAADGDRAATAA